MAARNKSFMAVVRTVFLMTAILLSSVSCYYDHADLSYPQSTSTAGCNVANVTYSSSVTGILNANCYNCHSGSAAAGGGIKLDSYSALKTYVSNGQLMNSINHTGGIAAMPLNGPQLSSCQIKTIQTWIDNGTPNN